MGIRKYTDEEKAFLIDFLPGHTYKETSDEFERLFGRPISAVRLNGCCNHWGIRTGTLGHFRKGHIPANTGKKVPPEHQAKETQFKPGHIPWKTRPVGSERIENGEVMIKVAQPNVWRLKKQCVWEQHNGKIPKWHRILFRDGNKTNLDIDNLALVSAAESLIIAKLNLPWHDAETFETILVMAKIRHEAAQQKKEVKK